MKSYPTFPVIIVETLARFFFPSLSMQTRETNIKERGGKQYVYSWNDQVLYVVFSGRFSINYDRDYNFVCVSQCSRDQQENERK